ncbi:MAG: amidohydrolase [Chromatocurvus sp.]
MIPATSIHPRRRAIGLIIGLTAVTIALATSAKDTLYYNGTIITIDDDRPLAEAVAIRDGRILAVGDEDAILDNVGEDVRRIDLKGRALLPGFVDSHGHAYLIGLQASTANLLPPPDGAGADIAALQARLTHWIAEHPAVLRGIGWVIGFGYDDSQLAEQRHPTRQELDAVSSTHPVMIIHQSGHFGVVNSKGLKRLGINADSNNPDGGIVRREADSRQPDGVLEEMAFLGPLMQLLSRFDDTLNERLVIEGTRLASAYGYTTVQEGRAMPAALAAMRRVAARGALDVDLVAYPDMLAVEAVSPSSSYNRRFRVGGVKLTIDGSPQGKTAYLSEPYFHPPHGQAADYRGYGAIDSATAMASVERAFANGWQILCHANGDAAIDQYIEAVRAAQAKYPDVGNRPVLIHGQTLRRDQVTALDELGIFPSLFPMHTFYWGDWHRESVLGPVRADNISPTGWLMERGMMFGSHHDAPVALPDSMRVLSATVTRRSRSGDILGPEHRVPVATALKAMTLWPAWQHFEEADKGSIEPGKLADFVILSGNPLDIPPEDLETLVVKKTIKEGRVVYTQE